MTADASRSGCPDCATGDDHCHGTLVVHRDGDRECVATASCNPVEERHHLVLDCRELDPPCGCTTQVAASGRDG